MALDGKVRIGTKLDSSGLEKGLKNIKGLVAGLGIAKVFEESLKSYAKFETGLAKASTLFGDVNVDSKALSSSMLSLSTATGETTETLNEGLYTALSAGVPVTEDMGEAMAFMTANTKLAKAGFTDVNTSVSATAKVLNAYGKDVSEIDSVSNVLMATQNKGITTVGELSQYLAQVTPIASAMGVSFESVGASLATMTAQGTPTAQATTQLRQVISELGKSGTIASNNLKDLAEKAGMNETSFSEMIDSGMSLGEILAFMDEGATASGQSMIDMFSSIEAGQGALALSGENAETLAENLEYMKDSTGLVDDAYDKMADTLTTQSTRVKTAIANLATSITSSSGNILTDLTGALADSLGKWEEAFSTDGFAGLFGSMLDSMTDGLGSLVDGANENIDELLTVFTTGLTGIVTKISDKAPEFFNTGIDLLSNLALGIFEALPTLAGTLAGSMAKMISNVFTNTKGNFKSVGIDLLVELAEGVGDTAKGLYTGFSVLIGNIVLIFQNTDWKSVGKDLLGQISNGIGSQVTALGKKVWDVAKSIGSIFKNAWKIATTDLTFEEVFNNAFDEVNTMDFSDKITSLDGFTDAIGEAFNLSVDASSDASKSIATFTDAYKDAFSGLKDDAEGVNKPLEDVAGSFEEITESSKKATETTGSTKVDEAKGKWDNFNKGLKEGVYSTLGMTADEFTQFMLDMDNAEGVFAKTTVMLGNVADSISSGVLDTLDDTYDALGAVTLGSKSWGDAMKSVGDSITDTMGDILKDMAKQLAGIALVKAITGDWVGAGLAIGGAIVLGYSGGIIGKLSSMGIGSSKEDTEDKKPTYEEDKATEAKSLQTQIETATKDQARAKQGMEASTDPSDIRYYTEMYLELGKDIVDLQKQLKFAQGFSTGGIVGGSSYTGDKLLSFVNSKEMILNTDQQESLYNRLSGLSAMATQSRGTTVVVNVNGDSFGVDDFYSKVYNGISQLQYEGALKTW